LKAGAASWPSPDAARGFDLPVKFRLSSTLVVWGALAGNLAVAVTKAIAAALTGSAAMSSEAIHSFVDTGNEVLLLYGIHRAGRRPDPEHPIGYGRELYFWSFIVALLLFSLGAGVSFYQGVSHVRHPEPIERPLVNYVVLALAFLFEGASWIVSLVQFRRAKGRLGFYEAFRRSKDPPSFMVLFEDTAALIGIVIAAAGITAAQVLDRPELDGVASIGIGLVLAVTAGLLARESKSLLSGERADPVLAEAIVRTAAECGCVAHANGIFTVQLAPDQVVAALSLEFGDALRAPEIEAKIEEIERRVKEAHPEVVDVFIKPQRVGTFHARQKALYEAD
jgi:cation diffusion facilitator family transporter